MAEGLGVRLAGAIFDCQYQRMMLEDVLEAALQDFFDRAGENAKFKRFDYYDASVEFWAAPGAELDELDLAVLKICGFDRAWVCYRTEDKGPQVGEKSYYFGRPSEPASTEEG